MKKYLLIIAIFFACLPVLKAQDDRPGEKRVEALYVAYVTQQLQLSPEEAQKFWPVHAQFESDMKGIKPDMPELDKQQAALNIKKRYQDNFNRVLGPNRCEHFFKLQGEFKEKLIRMRNQRQQQRPLRRGL